MDRDEPRFAHATVEMMERDSWTIPYFNGAYRFDKPPLTYWWMRLHYALLGVNELAARLHSVVAVYLTALVVAGMALWIAALDAGAKETAKDERAGLVKRSEGVDKQLAAVKLRIAELAGEARTQQDVVDDLGDEGHLEPSVRLDPPLFEGHAFEELHDEKDGAVFRAVVINHLNDATMIDLVGDVALAEEAVADAGVAGELGVEDLQRRARAIAVRGRIDGGHAADAEGLLDHVAPGQRGADARILGDDEGRAVEEAERALTRVDQVALGAGLHARRFT